LQSYTKQFYGLELLYLFCFLCILAVVKAIQMKNRSFLPVMLIFISLFLGQCNVKTLNALLGDQPLTESEVIQGLKKALDMGTEKTVNLLSQPGGYLNDAAIKILLPAEATKAIEALKKAPGGQQIYSSTIEPTVSDLIKTLNSSAEDAVKEAAPIFKDAITGMSITDAFSILRGEYKNSGTVSATRYFQDNTTDKLVSLYKPRINNSLNKTLVAHQSANSIWSKFVRSYNQVATSPANLLLKLEKVQEPDLSAFVTKKALDGMFNKIAVEEQNIRQYPLKYSDSTIQRVFGKQK
jgi:hypothetical protein